MALTYPEFSSIELWLWVPLVAILTTIGYLVAFVLVPCLVMPRVPANEFEFVGRAFKQYIAVDALLLAAFGFYHRVRLHHCTPPYIANSDVYGPCPDGVDVFFAMIVCFLLVEWVTRGASLYVPPALLLEPDAKKTPIQLLCMPWTRTLARLLPRYVVMHIFGTSIHARWFVAFLLLVWSVESLSHLEHQTPMRDIVGRSREVVTAEKSGNQ
jgi:hypothetical protein